MTANPAFVAPDRSPELPRIDLFSMLRLGLFQIGLGMMAVLTFGVLNQVLIKELKVDSTLAATLLAITLFVAPARLWFGQLSDTKPLWGLYRTGYIWLGIASLSLSAMAAIQAMWKLGDSLVGGWSLASTGWTIVLAALFALYGLSICASSTPFATLLVDVTEEEDRAKIVSIDWSMLLMGVIIGAITIGRILEPLETDGTLANVQVQVTRLFLVVPLVICVLTVLGTWGIEKKYSRFAQRQQGNKENIGLQRAWQILTTNRQTKIFFTFLIFMTFGLFLQDSILEPYANQIFNLPIGQAAQLNAFFGSGTVVGLLVTGFGIIPRFGKQRTARFGCGMVVYSMAWLIAAGFTANIAVLKLALVLFGICSGIVTTSALTLMLDLTLPEAAGTFIGAWGLSQALAKGVANIAGGGVLSLGKGLSGNLVLAYGAVFVVQGLLMLVAIWVLDRVNVREFKQGGNRLVQAAIANDLD
jgi:MFS transporter, BCD family, chlorophyll transporter